VRAIFAAVAKANAIGLPPNRHWTVHWIRAGVSDDEAAAATGALLTLVRDWLRKQGYQTGRRYVRRTSRTRIVGRFEKAAQTAPGAFLANLGIVTAYVAKGALTPFVQAPSRLGSDVGGLLIGKRWGRSSTLGSN
jgi:hypothetical protein